MSCDRSRRGEANYPGSNDDRVYASRIHGVFGKWYDTEFASACDGPV
jgi:hypothetical protein